MLASVYVQPSGAVDPATHAFANPHPWPLPNLTHGTASVFWQRAFLTTPLLTPTDAPLGDKTGVAASGHEQAVAAGSGPGGYPPNTPYSGIQLTSDGVWGAWLDTRGADRATEPLTTTTLESSFGDECVDVWAAGGSGRFAVEFGLAVPTAFKAKATDNSCAVYVSLSVYVRTKPGLPSHFVWYSTDLFDYERDVMHDHVYIDTVSQNLIVSSHVTGRSGYNAKAPGSAASSNATWPAPRRFGYFVTAAHLEKGIADGLARFPTHFPNGLPRNASDYCISGFNMELEATPGAAAGINLRGVTISVGR